MLALKQVRQTMRHQARRRLTIIHSHLLIVMVQAYFRRIFLPYLSRLNRLLYRKALFHYLRQVFRLFLLSYRFLNEA